MPLYFVRHPEAKVSLVHANNLLELYAATDCGQYVSRRPCTIQEYTKPLCLTFRTESPLLYDRYSSIEMFTEPDTATECLDHAEDLLTSGLYSDVTLVVEDQEFHCHKAILANRCEYFKVMFESDMRESSSERICLKSHSLSTMTQVLRFLYTGRVRIPMLDSDGQEVQSEEAAVDAKEMAGFFYGLWKAADFYRLSSLEKLVIRKIAECCQKQNVYLREEFLSYMYDLATEHNCEDLKNFVAGALSGYLAEISGQTAFDIVEELHPQELAQLVKHLYSEQRNLQEARDEDIVNGVLTCSNEITDIKQALKAAVEGGHLSPDSCALHSVCKAYVRSVQSTVTAQSWRDHWGSILDVFLSYNFDINKTDRQGDSALHVACRGDPDKIMSNTELSLLLIQWLLRQGANPHMANASGRTALDEAYGHINLCLPLIASYYFNCEDGLQLFSHGSLVQDFTEKINCLMRQEILLQSAMAEWKEEPKALLGSAKPNSIPANTQASDEQEECSESDSEESSMTEFSPRSRYVLNKAFLRDSIIYADRPANSPSDVYLGTKFDISDLIGDNENGVGREKFHDELFRFMYPRFHKYLHHLMFVGHEDSSYLEDIDIVKELECDAKADHKAAEDLCGSGLQLQSVDTMMLDRHFDEALSEAADMCMTSQKELLTKLASVS